MHMCTHASLTTSIGDTRAWKGLTCVAERSKSGTLSKLATDPRVWLQEANLLRCVADVKLRAGAVGVFQGMAEETAGRNFLLSVRRLSRCLAVCTAPCHPLPILASVHWHGTWRWLAPRSGGVLPAQPQATCRTGLWGCLQ